MSPAQLASACTRSVYVDAAFLFFRDLMVLAVTAAWLASVGWTKHDAWRRVDDRDGAQAAVLLAIFVPVAGALLYGCLRPAEPSRDARRRALRRMLLEAALEPKERCLVCRTPLEPEFRCCPVCALELRHRCDRCDQTIRATWPVCPYCGREQAPAVAARARVAA